jgi:hypothetical protein
MPGRPGLARFETRGRLCRNAEGLHLDLIRFSFAIAGRRAKWRKLQLGINRKAGPVAADCRFPPLAAPPDSCTFRDRAYGLRPRVQPVFVSDTPAPAANSHWSMNSAADPMAESLCSAHLLRECGPSCLARWDRHDDHACAIHSYRVSCALRYRCSSGLVTARRIGSNCSGRWGLMSNSALKSWPQTEPSSLRNT